MRSCHVPRPLGLLIVSRKNTCSFFHLSTETMSISESPLKVTYDDQGYVLVPDLISPDLHPTLRAACDRVIAKTRAGAWPHRRTVGKQFPPFDDTNPDSWGVQHVMHPALGEPVFARWYTSEGVRAVAAALLGCDAGALQMGACHGVLWQRSAVLTSGVQSCLTC